MDSIFLVDTTGRQEFNGEQQHQKIVYNKELLLAESDAYSEEDDEQNEGEVELFGLKLKSKEVLDVVSSLPDQEKPVSKVAKQLEDLGEKVESAVENSSKPKVVPRKRVTELNHDAPHLDLRQENLESNMKRTKQALNPGLEQAHALPTVGKRQQPIINRAERSKTKGKGWFNMPATEITDEMRNELKIVQMRSVLNPKQFYKKNDLKRLPKFFQIGTVLPSHLDHYQEKKSKKKQSLVNELLEDESFQKFNKRKYNEVIQRTDKYAYRKNLKKMKKLKKNKK
ncbi:deoxynucleotidyltransferase terminal-interacting protein 2 [Drosophila mauritiana]|uniref:Deoxynucleotidyltransferase terminal-interacting protein 2 n=1 Tax=Drosophila mauritiana TaxID=7226 RepID=A0A6P8KTG1_DROMA|nr:deoxynucleotidyltransferase terminal-interacting protein 2 [Drosophila mauritiana]